MFLAGDAGASTAKKGAFYAEKANVPCVQLPHGKIELGTAVGKSRLRDRCRDGYRTRLVRG